MPAAPPAPACLAALACLAGVAGAAAPTRPMFTSDAPRHAVREVYKRVDGRELALYLYLPREGPAGGGRPAIIFYSGGGWGWSGPSQFIRHCEYFASRGLVAAAAHFRVGSRPPFTPALSVEDAKSSIRWLRRNAARWGIDPDRIVASGYSSGGHMAACAALCAGFEAAGEDPAVSSVPDALVLINPAVGFGEHLRERGRRFGLSDEAWLALEPNRGIQEGSPPAFLAYGTEDELLSGGREFVEISGRCGNVVEMMTVEGEAHGFAKASPWHERVLVRADRFLASIGYLEGEPTIGEAEPAKATSPLKIGPGLIESWEDPVAVPWDGWDDTVRLDLVDRATHGSWGARMRFDFAAYGYPVMYHRAAAGWDLSGVDRLLVDVWVPRYLHRRLKLAWRIQRGRAQYGSEPVTLKRGWNTASAELGADWLPVEVRGRLDKMSWLLSADDPVTAGHVVFDRFRAR